MSRGYFDASFSRKRELVELQHINIMLKSFHRVMMHSREFHTNDLHY